MGSTHGHSFPLTSLSTCADPFLGQNSSFPAPSAQETGPVTLDGPRSLRLLIFGHQSPLRRPTFRAQSKLRVQPQRTPAAEPTIRKQSHRFQALLLRVPSPQCVALSWACVASSSEKNSFALPSSGFECVPRGCALLPPSPRCCRSQRTFPSRYEVSHAGTPDVP